MNPVLSVTMWHVYLVKLAAGVGAYGDAATPDGPLELGHAEHDVTQLTPQHTALADRGGPPSLQHSLHSTTYIFTARKSHHLLAITLISTN